MEERKQRLLVAVSKEAGRALVHPLADQFELIFCRTIAEAFDALPTGVDGVVCGLTFDDSRMFDFLRLLKCHSEYAALPFLCVRLVAPASRAPQGLSMVKAAVQLIGGNGFLDLIEIQDAEGEEAAVFALCTALRQLLPKPSPTA